MLRIVKKYTHKGNFCEEFWNILGVLREETRISRELCSRRMINFFNEKQLEVDSAEWLVEYQKLAPLLMKWHVHEVMLCEVQSRLIESKTHNKRKQSGISGGPLTEVDKDILRRAVAEWDDGMAKENED